MLSGVESEELWQLVAQYTDAVINRVIVVDHRAESITARMAVELEAVRRLTRWIDAHTEHAR